jgi:hypothetical protein
MAVETRHASKERVILRAKLDTTCNLLIWAACHDVVNKTMGFPVQESEKALPEQSKSKETKLGSLTVEKQSRENPDTSRGLFVTRAILQQAKLVQQAKLQKKEIDEAKKELDIAKDAELATKKSEALSHLAATTSID